MRGECERLGDANLRSQQTESAFKGVDADRAFARRCRRIDNGRAGVPRHRRSGTRRLLSAGSTSIGITGSNGKTTTTALIGHILEQSGIPARWAATSARRRRRWSKSSRAGPVERAGAVELPAGDDLDVSAHIGVCLNVTPDHLDRHGTLENYAAAKGTPVRTRQAEDYAVLERRRPGMRLVCGA